MHFNMTCIISEKVICEKYISDVHLSYITYIDIKRLDMKTDHIPEFNCE